MIKKCVLLFVAGAFSVSTNAQTATDGAFAPSVRQNYIGIHTPLDAEGVSVKSEISYYDGVGRPYQTVYPFSTPDKADLVFSQEYDSLGRLWKEWLPAIVKGNGGGFVENVGERLPAQYGDQRPFSITTYEYSPLNRVIQQWGAGDAWIYQYIDMDYYTNHKEDYLGDEFLLVKCYKLGLNDSLYCDSNYEDGELYIIRRTDEDGKIESTYMDKQDRTVLVRQEKDYETFHDTYYVYNDQGDLCYVLPPMYEEHPDLDLYAYQYKYDERRRCIAKKLPATDWIVYKYDKVGHLVYSQDGNQRQKREWTYHLSDPLGREVITGVGRASADTLPDISRTVIGAVRYDYAGATGVGYLVYDLKGMVTTVPLVVKYYDDYGFLNVNEKYSSELKFSLEDLPEAYKQAFASSSSVCPSAQGMLTGTFVSMSGTKGREGVMKAIYYDDKKNVVQTRSTNHRKYQNGYDKDWFLYSYSGSLLKHLHTYEDKTSALSDLNEYTYDHAERLTQVDHTFGDAPKVTLATYTYDELGRVASKSLHNGQFTQSYTYNIRNWLKSVSSPFFEEKLYYTEKEAGNVPQYCGNIGTMTWKAGEETERGYNFRYDRFGSLSRAYYRENGVASSHYDTQYGYDQAGNLTWITRNGLKNKEPELEFGEIDRLYLTYQGHLLKQVTDSAAVDTLSYPNNFNFVDGAHLEEEYVYDKSGNLLQDFNKGMSKIGYNSLNLPDTVILANKDKVIYNYGGDGEKYRKECTNLDINYRDRITEYCGNAIYGYSTLKILLTEEGFITFENKTPVYHYYLKDHQGNNRIVVRQDSVVEQVNHYYPFGGLFGESSGGESQSYKYNGKELDQAGEFDWYDYGARMYDAALGRWYTADPSSEKSYEITPYGYCNNNPLNRIDPDGKQGIPLPAPLPLPFYYPVNYYPQSYNLPSDQQIMRHASAKFAEAGRMIADTPKMSYAFVSLLYYQAKNAISPEYEHQRKRDRRTKEELDLNQANVAKSIDTNVTGMMPNGDPAPKRDPKDGGWKVIGGIVVSAVGASANGALEVTNPKPPQDAVTAHEEVQKERIEKNEPSWWRKLIDPILK